jgi:hypothetical protein
MMERHPPSIAALPNIDLSEYRQPPTRRDALIECVPGVRSDCHSEDGLYMTAGQPAAYPLGRDLFLQSEG